MRAFNEFRSASPDFWAFIKFISESLGYTKRGQGIVKSYSEKDILNLLNNHNLPIDHSLIQSALAYTTARATLLNNYVESILMDADTAKNEFEKLLPIHTKNNFSCKLPMNKQSGAKKQRNYFTCIINILTEQTLREITKDTTHLGFDDDPRGLTYVLNENNNIVGASSRRFDGAYPSIHNPLLVWEIKEYYYATTFGSRIADGVYETQLDGLEFQELYSRTGYKVHHTLFVDAYSTWWEQGKSYLCRLIDALNAGLVDELIIGREVLTRWPELLRELVPAPQK